MEVRIDRFVCSSSWKAEFNLSRVINITKIGLDHSPIMVTMDFIEAQGKNGGVRGKDSTSKSTGVLTKSVDTKSKRFGGKETICG